MSGESVLVTGGSGFVASRCLLHLLDRGYHVRTTVRSPARAQDVRRLLAQNGSQNLSENLSQNGKQGKQSADEVAATADVSITVADLTSDDGWAQAVAGCDYVLHVASPFSAGDPQDADDLIVPAREGTLRVLRAARAAGVRRVVLTSSFAAIGYGHGEVDRAFTERDWTDPGADVSAYVKAKTLAERAAWDFAAREGEGLELAVVNPAVVLGPVLGPNYATSVDLVKRLLDGALPGAPRLTFPVVDVRDVADLHLLAMTHPAAAGERFLASAGESVSMYEIALLLRDRLGPAAARVPTRQLPDWVIHLAAKTSPATRQIVPDLGAERRACGEKATRLLGWRPRTPEQAVLAAAQSLIDLGLAGGVGGSVSGGASGGVGGDVGGGLGGGVNGGGVNGGVGTGLSTGLGAGLSAGHSGAGEAGDVVAHTGPGGHNAHSGHGGHGGLSAHGSLSAHGGHVGHSGHNGSARAEIRA